MSKTYADLFTGFGGATIGAMAAGLKPLWGIEWREDVAEVANANLGKHVQVADILDCNPMQFDRTDVLHASPPCPNFSKGKINAAEASLDLDLAQKVADFISVLLPEVFTLENVWGYNKSQSWNIIQERLYECGYWVSAEHVNAADYSVPQVRKRMIVRATRNNWISRLPYPEKWIGWHEAIEDLLDILPESQFAPFQKAHLPKVWPGVLLVQGENSPPAIYDKSKPVFTIRSSRVNGTRAWLSQDRIVAMSSRALARFQSFPDWYKLPEKRKLATYGIGNACCPLLMEKIYKQIMGVIDE